MERRMNWKTIAAAVIGVLMLAALVTVSVLYGFAERDKRAARIEVENGYQRAFYTLTDNLFETEYALKKLKVASTPTMQGKFLADACIASGQAAEALNNLAFNGSSMNFVVRALNQIMGYCEFMNKKLSAGDALSDAEKADIDIMYEIISEISEAMDQLQQKVISEGYLFIDNLNNEDDAWMQIVADLETKAEKYPIFNFEGNVCNELEDPEPKGLTGEKISQEDGKKIIEAHFKDRGVKSVKLLSENDRKMAAYYFQVELEKDSATVEISKVGGKILTYTVFREVSEPKYDEAEGVIIAKQYLAKFTDFEDLEVYCVSNVNSTLYIDFVAKQDDVWMLADTIKVKVALDDGEILGLNTTCYYMNHHTRGESLTPTVSEAEVRSIVGPDMTISEIVKVMFTIGSEELLCYEIRGTFDDEIYYIYIDAHRGYEIEIYRVIDSDEGKLFK